jgi:hypothetical protein
VGVNSRSLADFVLGFNVEGDDEISLEKWVPPTSTPPEIRLLRKYFAAEVEGLPECDSVDEIDDDDPLTVAATAEGSKPFLDLSTHLPRSCLLAYVLGYGHICVALCSVLCALYMLYMYCREAL